MIFGYPYSSTIMSGVCAAWCPQQRSRLTPSRTHSRAVTTHAKPLAQQQLARDLEVERAAMGQRSRPQSSGPGLLCAGTSALCVNLCLTDRVWVNRPKRTSNHERLCIHETAGTPSVTLAVVVTRTLLCNVALCVCRSEPVLGLLFFFFGRGCSPGTYVSTYTYLGSRADMRYVRIWYIIPHTKTKRSRTRVHACRLFFWDVSIRNSLRSNKKSTLAPLSLAQRHSAAPCGVVPCCTVPCCAVL